MSIPPRVGGALVVLGDNNGQSERSPGHILTPPTYGAGNHHYFASYPVTTPSNVITKAWGLLGTTPGPDVTVTPDTLPKNSLVIVCYKTELNHYFPDAAKDALGNIPTFDTTDALYYFPPPGTGSALNTGSYPGTTEEDLVNAWTSSFNGVVAASFAAHTDVTDLIATPLPVPGLHPPGMIFPRWTAETEWDRFGYEISPYFIITPAVGQPYSQTRTGESTTPKYQQEPLDYITPWYVASSGGLLYSELRLQCDFSYKFTEEGEYDYTTQRTEWSIVYPWYKFDGTGFGRLIYLPDEASWQYVQNDAGDTTQPYPAGAYRVAGAIIKPEPDGPDSAFVRYESKATHGLFLDADGSCWNMGTTLKVRVHIWKAPPKRCFFPNNETATVWNGNSTAFTNFERGLPTTYKEYEPNLDTYSYTNLTGPIKGRGTLADPFLGWETGVPTQIGYSLPVPKPVEAHYWGCVFTPDFDSEACEEVEVLDFTVLIDESNTYTCDGSARPSVGYTQWGVKLQDIELPTIEGFITYIKDFEVYEVINPGQP